MTDEEIVQQLQLLVAVRRRLCWTGRHEEANKISAFLNRLVPMGDQKRLEESVAGCGIGISEILIETKLQQLKGLA